MQRMMIFLGKILLVNPRKPNDQQWYEIIKKKKDGEWIWTRGIITTVAVTHRGSNCLVSNKKPAVIMVHYPVIFYKEPLCVLAEAEQPHNSSAQSSATW